MKADLWAYKKAISHYKSILSSAPNSWIAWNKNGHMIGVSNQFRTQFELEDKSIITVEDVINQLPINEGKVVANNLEILKTKGIGFSININLANRLSKFELTFSKLTNKNTETISVWCKNITAMSSTFDKMQKCIDFLTKKKDILERILDNLPVPVWYRDQDLKIVYCNNTYTSMLDLSKETILQKNIPLVSGNILGQGHSLAENVKKTGKKQSITQSVVFRGMRKKMSVCECPFAADIIGYALDNTALEDAIGNLDKVIATQGEVLESLPTAIAIFGQNMRLSYFNSAYKKLTNFDELWLSANPLYGEVLDRQRICRQLPEYADFSAYKHDQIQMFTSLLEQKQDLIHLPNGKVLRRCVAPYPLGGLIFLYDDVSDSMALKRENNTILAVQKETINNLIEGVSVFGSDNRLRFINPNMLKLLDITDEVKEGSHISEFIEHIRRQIDYIGDWEVYKGNVISNLTDRIMKTGRLLKKNGGVIFFSYTPLPDGSHLHSYMDVTDTCKVELALYEKDQAISISNNLKHEFISSISSEIRNPINIIVGYAELLGKQYFGQLNEKQTQYCSGILEASNKLTTLVDNIKAMNDVSLDNIVISKELFNLKELILEVINSIKSRSENSEVEISFLSKESEFYEIYADKKIIRQIQSDMLMNLIKLLSKGSSITVSLDEDGNNFKIITVANDSIIKHKSKLKVFQRMTLKHVARITVSEQINIGILTVKSLLKKHGGDIDVVRNGADTTIICTLPKTEDDSDDGDIVTEKVA